jgi:FdhD protein
VDEAPIWISINGERRALLVCSPSETDALAVGYLLGNGSIRGAGDVQSLRTVSGPGGAYGVEIELDRAMAEAAADRQRHMLRHGCGPRHLLDCAEGRAALQSSLRRDVPVRAAPDLTAAFRSLFAAADEASPQGGVHAAALCDGGALHHAAVDVARHCAVDRVLGLAALAGEDLSAWGLIITSRISGLIALKAVHAGVGWVASRSLATPLARELAGAAALPLHEHAARRKEHS